MPYPPRMAVFPVPNGSHAAPMRGSNVRSDGFLKKKWLIGVNRVGGGDDTLAWRSPPLGPNGTGSSPYVWLVTSEGIVDGAYRKPRLNVTLDVIFQSSCAYMVKSHDRALRRSLGNSSAEPSENTQPGLSFWKLQGPWYSDGDACRKFDRFANVHVPPPGKAWIPSVEFFVTLP